MHPIRRRLALSLLVPIPLGIGTKLYGGPAAGWVHGHAGGILYVIFWTVVVVLAVPSLSPWTVAGGVFIVTYGLEFLQLWSPSGLEAIRNTFFGHALLGAHSDDGTSCTTPSGRCVEGYSYRGCLGGPRPTDSDRSMAT
ncbi:MAG: DUF2809 domain-containing protein [Bacteroidetes bacterium SW_11_64_17]|nr:MAG: DUF2809 domain-containing protein [Bacteroidetes bacterium SW_11_64_17]